jgi:hypothetical protein
MKKILFLFMPLLLFACVAMAQKISKATVKGKTTHTKSSVKKPEPLNMDMYIKNEDGSTYSEPLKRGDQLVYHVNAGGKEYDFIVKINDGSYSKGVDFNYQMTAPVNLKGHVKILAKGKNDSRKYVNYFGGGEMILKDACTVWMTGANFMELPAKQTKMTFDNEEEETFYNYDNNEITPAIKFRGKEVKLDGFILSNSAEGKGSKTLWIQNGSGNPLILKMDLGWTIELKEII